MVSTVIERLFATDSVDETLAAQESAFPGAVLRMSEPTEDFHYRQTFRGNLALQLVRQVMPAISIECQRAPLRMTYP